MTEIISRLSIKSIYTLRLWVTLVIILIASLLVITVNLPLLKYMEILIFTISAEIFALNVINLGVQHIFYSNLELDKWLSLAQYIDFKKHTVRSKQDYLLAELRVNYYKGNFKKVADFDFSATGELGNPAIIMLNFDLFKTNMMLENFEKSKNEYTTTKIRKTLTKKDKLRIKENNEFSKIMVNILQLRTFDAHLDDWLPYKQSRLSMLEKKYFQALNSILKNDEMQAIKLFHEVVQLGNDQLYYVGDSKNRLRELEKGLRP
ncbi:hypothetical protein ESZ50_07430 [Weissella muntiaci]|uniref:Uncharacterized protein n=1 Tax=Weissella muntiaci TaxID=2508881 RepID=A0A6C2C5T7_9LACO|nr:hypothetical protein [Weissella muntiaci]TYC49069.1 hypothetical protein ESZ50_07430 [Weissella muntiaci]